MSAEPAPFEIRRLAEERKAARASREWAEADRIKGEIEAAGWKVIDRGRSFDLERAHPPDAVEDAIRRYGASASVPSRLAEPSAFAATVVAVVTDHAPGPGFPAPSAEVQVVLVANHPTSVAAATLAGMPATPDATGANEVVWTNGRFGHAAALNAGIRRAAGDIVVLAEPTLALAPDALHRLAAALADTAIGVAGGSGWHSDDFKHLQPALPGSDATAIDGRLIAFRRSDIAERGPLDEAFVDPHWLDIWWSMALRDEGPDRPPRHARVVDMGMPGATTGERDADERGARSHAARRNFYRLLKSFGGRRDLGTT